MKRMKRVGKEDVRLSRGCDVVGFFDVANPDRMIQLWQMHTVPLTNEWVTFEEGTSLPEALGVWEVVQRLWICMDSPITVRLLIRKVRAD